jgi:hypothetical protein
MALNSSGLTWNIIVHTKPRAAMPSPRKVIAATAADAISYIKARSSN